MCIAGLRTSPQFLIGFGVGLRLRGVSPGAQLVLSPAQPGSRSLTRHDLLPGKPNAVTSALPPLVILRHFLHWSSWTLSSGPPLRQGPRNDTGAGSLFRCPLQQCSRYLRSYSQLDGVPHTKGDRVVPPTLPKAARFLLFATSRF